VTATKTRAKPSVEGGLKEREQKWNKARAKASALGSEHGIKLRQAQELADQRRQLIHRNPELVDHLGVPVGPNNPVGKVVQAVEKLGDLQDLALQVEHARQVERSTKQSWDDFVSAHFAELLDLHRPEAAAVALSANEAARALATELRKYLAFHSRIAGFTHPVQGITTHVVPGLEAANDLLRVVDSVDLKPPIPEEVS
jgi:hypothetical protein